MLDKRIQVGILDIIAFTLLVFNLSGAVIMRDFFTAYAWGVITMICIYLFFNENEKENF